MRYAPKAPEQHRVFCHLKKFVPVVVAALVLASCSGTSTEATDAASTAPASTASASTDSASTDSASTAPAPTAEAGAPAPGSVGADGCVANTSGQVDLARDLISLHYDHAPDLDDAHATAAGKEVATALGFTPWVVGGAYGADNAKHFRPKSQAVMDAVWGTANWANAHTEWDEAVQRTADRWQLTVEACGDVWIAEGGQSDFSADSVRELQQRLPNLDTTVRIHLVQHSRWNEDQALDADLDYVRQNTNYIHIPDGNNLGNGTAGFKQERYDGRFLSHARNGPNATGWDAAFEYYPPEAVRLDFSDTVELLAILNIGTDQVNTIEDFADTFMQPE